jgi:hypothetical protein
MVSHKFQVLDIGTLLQIPQVRLTLKIGSIPKIKMGLICVISIRYLHFAFFRYIVETQNIFTWTDFWLNSRNHLNNR